MQTDQSNQTRGKPGLWSWIPILCFASGLPYVVVMTVSVIMYKRQGLSNMDIALYTSWLWRAKELVQSEALTVDGQVHLLIRTGFTAGLFLLFVRDRPGIPGQFRFRSLIIVL